MGMAGTGANTTWAPVDQEGGGLGTLGDLCQQGLGNQEIRGSGAWRTRGIGGPGLSGTRGCGQRGSVCWRLRGWGSLEHRVHPRVPRCLHMSLHPGHCPQGAPSPPGGHPQATGMLVFPQPKCTPGPHSPVSPHPEGHPHRWALRSSQVYFWAMAWQPSGSARGPRVTGAAGPVRLGIALIPARARGAAARLGTARHSRSPGLQTGRGKAFTRPQRPAVPGTGAPQRVGRVAAFAARLPS